MEIKNIFSMDIKCVEEEFFENILANDFFTLERIISHGQATVKGKWYDQDMNEWILLIKGSAGLRFKDDKGVYTLKPGDYLNIPAHKQHRVEWTDPQETTFWLALYYKAVLNLGQA